MSNESKSLFGQEFLTAEREAHYQRIENELELEDGWEAYTNTDSIEIKTDSDGDNFSINSNGDAHWVQPEDTYTPLPGGGTNPMPDPTTPNGPKPGVPDADDFDLPGDADDWAEYVKKVKEREEADIDSEPDPEELEAHEERVNKLVKALLKWLLKQDRSEVHMADFMEDFDVVQKALVKVRSGQLLSDIEMHALNRIYNDYGRQE